MNRDRRGMTLVEALVATAFSGLVLALLANLLCAAGARGGEQADRARQAAARDRLELALRRDLRRSVGGVHGATVAPGGATLELVFLDPTGPAWKSVVWSVDGEHRLRRDGQPLAGLVVRSFRVELSPPFVPGEPARLQLRIETEHTSLLIVHLLHDGEVLL